MQRRYRACAVAVQAIEVLRSGKVNVSRIDQLRAAINQLPCAQLAVAPQLLIEQGLLLFDHLRFEQQGADFSCCADVRDVRRLAQHARFIGITQV